MTKHDSTTEALGDVIAACGLLTRLPLPQRAVTAGPRAAWAWPVVGAVVGFLSAAAGALALWLGLPVGVAAAVALATSAMVTGGLHEDGLADTADGLFGGWTRERRLEIMKDSRIGSYGMLALMITGLARWSALTALIATPNVLLTLIAAGARTESRRPTLGVSVRAPVIMNPACCCMSCARRSGLPASLRKADPVLPTATSSSSPCASPAPSRRNVKLTRVESMSALW
jgi:hypothetical protein